MGSKEFAYWLQGFFEVANPEHGLDKMQTQIIKDHLALVFDKVTPDRSGVDEVGPISQLGIRYRDQLARDEPIFCGGYGVYRPDQSACDPAGDLLRKLNDGVNSGTPSGLDLNHWRKCREHHDRWPEFSLSNGFQC